jgi:hypothetical protein
VQFAVFFSDGAGFGIEMVQALDAAHAEDIARAQHPSGRLSAMPAELLDGQDLHKLLRAYPAAWWLIQLEEEPQELEPPLRWSV